MGRSRDEDIALIAGLLPQVMGALMSRHPMRTGDWGDITIGVSAATGLVDRLVERGVLERESDPADRRVVRVRMSPAGLRAAQEWYAAQILHMGKALSTLSDEDIRRVAEATQILHRAVTGE